ncbi:DUF5988 family protein [Actinomadura livida]|uniref:DUF5988 family protein n=1 Tax=Actinomadura livida TaxID=79909 RepID=A0A7W7IF06_9ACTN|nr:MULTISPECIES: DUF5988 family protein [Actinomadura]MBB4775914.1 hypothetical protein [Actinomadura catellatispora]GGU16803.1 hypothetical protein GCM10010208_47520 [Actinomadura livida]
MKGLDDNAARSNPIDVVLVGGPDDLPVTARRMRAPAADETIKIPHRGGYEHFERERRLGRPDDRETPVFRWTMRTKIAE